ncbi:hypothetical protein [Pseudolysinimonas yzui]|uniref:Uncharacterized protein n=1 Tax=Pseudolysinimonas yzui TaxID=2708254 RepID=A0A8J3GNP0_9MICO|nr:hypothetical protein [Pseudolysinimonas yzui]GHF07969.1 hypothetical protein GCM10011600_05930 [Pseudolysinimonas yzui]
MRWKPFRITEVWAKVAYVLVAWILVPALVRWSLEQMRLPDVAVLTVDLVLGFVVVGVGCRAFRARGEAVEPPRVWWRATGRPAMGFVLFAFFALALVGFFFPYPDPVDPLAWWYLASSAPIAVFYLHSSIRLSRGDAPVPPRSRKNDDLRLIDRRQRL